MLKKKINFDQGTCISLENRKRIQDLIQLAYLSRQIINQFDDPEYVVGLQASFIADMLTDGKQNIHELYDDETAQLFIAFRDKIRERWLKHG